MPEYLFGHAARILRHRVLPTDGPYPFGQGFQQGGRAFAVRAVFTGRIKVVTEQIFQVFNRKTALFDLFNYGRSCFRIVPGEKVYPPLNGRTGSWLLIRGVMSKKDATRNCWRKTGF